MACKEAISAADETLDLIAKAGHDYSAHRDQIIEAFDNGLLCGNWDVTVDCGNKLDIRIIQEDEYDQSLDEDEDDIPEHSDMIGYVCNVPAYIWLE